MAEKDAVPTAQLPEVPQPKINQVTDQPQAGANQVQVNVDFLKTTRVHICMPCYGGMLTESCFMSYIKWANVCRQLGIDWTMETMTNESLISRARNTLTAKFLHNKESTHLMFIDTDNLCWELVLTHQRNPFHQLEGLLKNLFDQNLPDSLEIFRGVYTCRRGL